MKIERLTTNVFVATELRGCNAGFVVTSEGVVLIDVCFVLDQGLVVERFV